MPVEYGDNWKNIATQVKRRDNYTCQKCGRQFPPFSTFLHVHHILPLSRGGSNTPENLITLCRDCHKDDHPHMEKGYAKKLAISNKRRKYRPLVK